MANLPGDYKLPSKVALSADVVYGFHTVHLESWADPIAVGTNKAGFTVAEHCRLRRIVTAVVTKPTGTGGVTVDVNVNGSTIFTNQAHRPNIAAAGTATSAVVDVDVALEPGDVVTFDVDAVGGTEPGEYLSVAFGLLPDRPS